MNAIILSIGDELVLGQTVDTNSAWISQQLAAVGAAVVAHMTVPDDQPAIERAIAESAARCDVLIVSGGIGLPNFTNFLRRGAGRCRRSTEFKP
jgi:nicotinamide-nucleotide amidase